MTVAALIPLSCEQEVVGITVQRASARPPCVWFICESVELKERFRAEAFRAATERLRATLVDAGFPATSAESLRSDVTSREEIEAGGGKFHFFR